MPLISVSSVPNYATLSAMITPAIFMTVCGSLIISTSNRVSRVVDRIRELNERLDQLRRGTELDFVPERIKNFVQQLSWLEDRSSRIRIALAALYLAMAAFIGTSLAVALDVRTQGALGELPTILAAFGVVLLLCASYQLFRECWIALLQNRKEIDFFRSLRARTHGDQSTK